MTASVRRALPLYGETVSPPRESSASAWVHALIEEAAPSHPDHHLFETRHGSHVLVADGSRVYDLDEATRDALARVGDAAARALDDAGLSRIGFVNDEPLVDPPLRSLSLAVAQSCNLGCGYCYAEGGDFGGPARAMPWEVAEASIDRLLREAQPGDRAHLSFLGGEPMIARELIRRATEHASLRARAAGVVLGFSITTNGTLLTPEDGAFFEDHGFAVTLSLDGIGEDHDRLRPFKGGKPSYARIIANATPLLAMQRRMQVSARVTVTPQNLALRRALDRFVEMGFHSVGFSPMISSPGGRHELASVDIARLLEAMIECGLELERRALAGQRYPFSNLTSALREIHRGTHRPYPCGAGAGYFGVSAGGELYACHRFVEDEAAKMGSVQEGIDREARNAWLSDRHVHRQEPCRSCWARYLCGGGCHHEVIRRGRPACDYVRGWLHFCLRTYVHLLEQRPDFFAGLGSAAAPPEAPAGA